MCFSQILVITHKPYIQGSKRSNQGIPMGKLQANKGIFFLPGAISFDIGSEHFLGPHGPLGPMRSPKRKKTADKCGVFQEDASGLNSELLYGPPRYHFEQHPRALPHGPLRQAHEHICNLERWNKAQDRTIFKLKEKCKALSKTVKRQAEASAQFMKKVADILTRGAIAGCSSSDFDFLTPQPQPSIALKLLPSIVSRLRDLCGSSAISASCCTISATSVAPSRARILATGSGPLRPKPLIAAHYADDLENLYKVYGVDRSVVLDLVGTHETPETVREGYYGAYLSFFHSCGLIFPIPEPILEANNEFSETLEKRLQDVSCSGELYEIKKVICELKRANATQLAAAEKLGTQAASLEARLRVVSNERKSALGQVSFLEVRVESFANKFSDDLRRATYDAKKTMVDSYLDVMVSLKEKWEKKKAATDCEARLRKVVANIDLLKEIMNNNLLASDELLRLRAKKIELRSKVDVMATSDFSVGKLDLPQISEDLPEDFFAKDPSAADDVAKCSGDRFEDGEFSIEEWL
ncbi:hypothetical protein DY000_02031087 [Brassica cretica]|uniref:Arabidopsis retrotransposon Orf1 C-terminal domain-containing protein n=1 Tax=Brassica cretica TaxID=69181 RepID=A0ABQ7DT39_BRACR|nr:hypothetical protein DY000_02031087 [Brassica cretica]